MASVAIVGRPNVGKSSLFNRIVGRREAIVADESGVTRDVKSAEVVTDLGARFTLLDTGGLWSGDRWQADIRARVSDALEDVALVLFCIDGRSGVHSGDEEIAQWLRSQGKAVMLVATKVDDPRHEEAPAFLEAYSLGFGEPFATAAEHARGTFELVDEIVARLPPPSEDDDDETQLSPIRVAIVGRPNVGKSSIVNAILGKERVIVADLPGTTRDSVDVRFEYGGRPFILVDTAGLRRKPGENVEYYASLRSEEAMWRADVAVLVIDPFELGDHEMRVANIALERGVPVVLAINKWDLVPDEELDKRRADIAQQLNHLDFAPHVETSALTEFGLFELLAITVRLYDTARRRVGTGALNGWIEVWTQRQAPPNFAGRPLRIYYGSQVDVAPPTFHFSVNSEKYVTRPYEQYLRNRIRDDLGLSEIPFRTIFKSRRDDGGKRVRT
ncbi:MAG: ribosome biogenesis GTPase Der [Trueperaceae bacterium]|nr:ribosome biogenesis GTPase Der [Trueperaceae bacterium]